MSIESLVTDAQMSRPDIRSVGMYTSLSTGIGWMAEATWGTPEEGEIVLASGVTLEMALIELVTKLRLNRALGERFKAGEIA